MANFRSSFGLILAGAAAGAVNGTLGAGGGMLLVPLLGQLTDLEEQQRFAASVCMMLPMCLVSLLFLSQHHPLPWSAALPYLIGSAAGGELAGLLGVKIPTLWLHRLLGGLILLGGLRYLW